MTATATTARATLADLASDGFTAAGVDGVNVYDYDPPPGVAIGSTALIVTHSGRERHMDRYDIRVEMSTSVYTAEQLADRAETVVETADLAFSTGLPGTWQIGKWRFGLEQDAALYVAHVELLLPTGDPAPSTSIAPTIAPLTMTTARAAIATAVSTATAGVVPAVTVYDFPTWPGLANAPIAAVVAPVALDRDRSWHRVAVLVSGVLPADQAQGLVDDLVVDIDDGLRSNLDAAYALLGSEDDVETGWDRVGWDDEFEAWTAQVGVAHLRGRW